MPKVECVWRGAFSNVEVIALHADAFDTGSIIDESEWNWVALCAENSLGWVTARIDRELVGFVNVISDGFVHAWIQDVMVASSAQRKGIGVKIVHLARDKARDAGCEWLHVDFDDEHRPFYFDAIGFQSTTAGLIDLTDF